MAKDVTWLSGDFPGGPVVTIPYFHAEGMGSIPDQGIKILCAKNKQKKIYCDIYFKNSFNYVGK